MKITLSLLLLQLTFSRVKCESMESLESAVQIKPGETLSLSCRGSGFTFSSYGMHWIRQQTGKPLVWMGYSGSYAASFRGRTEITRDDSKSMVYLKLSGVTAEDSAVYYCARHDYFDYWGKGTQVTVSSGVQTPPSSIFAVSSCGASSDGFHTLGCVTSGFSPAETLTFSWTGDVTGKVDYPAMQSSGAYTAVSQVQVKNSDWEAQKSFTCQVQHPALSGSGGAKTATIKKPDDSKPAKEDTFKATFSLKINPPSAKDLFVQNRAIITCVITGDNKKEVEAANVSWTFGKQPASAGSTVTDNVKETTAPFTKNSMLTLSESEWFSGKEVKCSTEKDKTPFSETINVRKGGKRPSVLFYKPEKHVSDADKVSLLCEVSSSDLGNVYIMWQKNNDPYMEGSSTVRVNVNTVLSYLTVSGKDYNDKNNKFTCAAKDANMKNDTAPKTAGTSKSKQADCPPCRAD